MTTERDAARIREIYKFHRFPGKLTVSHDGGLACLEIVSKKEFEPGRIQHVWLTIASHRSKKSNAAMRITLNGNLHRICQHCNILRAFESLEEERCEECLKPRTYYKPDPLKVKARAATNKAIRSGLVRGEPDGCEDCGTTEERLTIHHVDYSQPLEIEWLCTTCHGRRHRGGKRFYAFSGYAEARMAWI